MAMSPKLLRPKATGTSVPQFSEQGYSRLWCLTTKSSGNVSGSASSDTGHYAVKWWDNTTTVYDSGDPFSKAAAGNQRAFEVYPCDSGGVASGQFDGFDVSDNSLTQVRAEDVSLEDAGAGGSVPGSVLTWYGYNYYSTYVSGSPAETGDISGNNLSSVALDQFYTDLDAGGGDLFVSGNPGINADDPTIATAKGYTVLGSVPPSTSLLLNFNGGSSDSSPNAVTLTATGTPVYDSSIKKYGSHAVFMDGGQLASSGTPIPDLAGDDWTVEFWLYVPTSNITGGPYGVLNLGNTGDALLQKGLNVLVLDGVFLVDDGTGGDGGSVPPAITPDEWHHYAIVVSGGQKSVYVDGVYEDGGNMVAMPGPYDIVIGDWHPGGWSGELRMDDLRIVKGAALYTANFTPPTSQLGVYP